jgi:hypothetical protein
MPQLVENRESYSDADARGNDIQSVNNTGAPIWVCDCHGPRVVFRSINGNNARQLVDAHEGNSFRHTSLSDMGISVGLGEEAGDYLGAGSTHPSVTNRNRSY